MEIVWLVLAVGICVGLAWLGLRIEPHFVSKDGTRFLCSGQKLTLKGDHLGRWRETRVMIGRTGGVQVDQKQFLRRTTTFWTVEARSPDAPRGKAVFLLRGHDDQGVEILMALRMPQKSRAVDILTPHVRGAKRSTPPAPADEPTPATEPSPSADPAN